MTFLLVSVLSVSLSRTFETKIIQGTGAAIAQPQRSLYSLNLHVGNIFVFSGVPQHSRGYII